MAITFITYRKAASWPPLKTHSTRDTAEAASRVAVNQAERGESVLLITGSPDKWTNQSRISEKPFALRVAQRLSGFQGLVATIEEFATKLNNPSSKEWATGFRRRPLVVLNDADFFLSEGDEQFTLVADEVAIARLVEMEKALRKHAGSLIVFAELCDEKKWKQAVKARKWQSHRLDEFLRLGNQVKDQPANSIQGADAIPPAEYPFGPIQGTKKALSAAILLDGKVGYRRVLMKVRTGNIWAKEIHKRLTEVWFRSEQEFLRAKSRMQERE